MDRKLALLLAFLPLSVSGQILPGILSPTPPHYASKATVSFSAATGSTQTNITLAFAFSDAKLKTVANGGQIQHTVVRGGVTVPADFILTSDTTCKTLSGGWTWGISPYDGTTGAGFGVAKVPSLTVAGPVVPTVCIGNSAVSTYQGGAVGAEYDGFTAAAWHLSNDPALNVKDSSSNGNDGTNNGATATSGQIDGAANFVQASSQYIDMGTGSSLGITGDITVSAWVNLAGAGGSYKVITARGVGNAFYFYIVNQDLRWYDGIERISGFTIPVSTWTHVAFVRSGTDGIFYVGGVSVSTVSGMLPPAPGAATATIGDTGGTQFFDGIIDELRVDAAARSGDWMAVTKANQASPPSIGAFTAL